MNYDIRISVPEGEGLLICYITAVHFALFWLGGTIWQQNTIL